MNNYKQKGGFLTMNATRANTTITIDGAAIGSTTETPPEDPPGINFSKVG